MRPTNYFRILVHTEVDPENSTNEYIASKQVEVLQQFMEHHGGKETVGDMFVTIVGSWQDVPKVMV